MPTKQCVILVGTEEVINSSSGEMVNKVREKIMLRRVFLTLFSLLIYHLSTLTIYYSLRTQKVEHIYYFWPSTINRAHSFMENFQQIMTLYIILLTLLLIYFFFFFLTLSILHKNPCHNQLLYFLWTDGVLFL